MSQHQIIKLIEKRGMLTSDAIAKELNLSRSSISAELKRLENKEEIKSFEYHNQGWKIYCTKEVFEELNVIHKIRDNPRRQRAENELKNPNIRGNSYIYI